MPKGVYLRKKKNGAVSEPSPLSKAAETKVKRGRKPGMTLGHGAQTNPANVGQSHVGTASGGSNGLNSYQELHTHLQVLTQARMGQNFHDNAQLLGYLDTEIISTLASLRLLRESRFPSTPAEKPVPQQTVGKQHTPLPAPVQAQMAPTTSSVGAPPLPFTPQSVQDALKSPAPQQ